MEPSESDVSSKNSPWHGVSALQSHAVWQVDKGKEVEILPGSAAWGGSPIPGAGHAPVPLPEAFGSNRRL